MLYYIRIQCLESKFENLWSKDINFGRVNFRLAPFFYQEISVDKINKLNWSVQINSFINKLGLNWNSYSLGK